MDVSARLGVKPTSSWMSVDRMTADTETEVTEPGQGADEVVVITDMFIKARSGSTATIISIFDGSGGTALFQGEFEDKFGVNKTLNAPLHCTKGNSPYIDSSAAGDVDVCLSGYVVKQ